MKHGKIVARLVPDCGFMDGKPEEDEPLSLFPSPRSCVAGRGRAQEAQDHLAKAMC